MSNLLTFHNNYCSLRTTFEQAVTRAASRITLTELLKNMDLNPDRNPSRPRLESSSELEAFKEGDAIELGALYLTPHNCPSYKLIITRKSAELYSVDCEKPIRTFSEEVASRLYDQWLIKIKQAIERIPAPPF